MKKILLTALLVSSTVGAFAQGIVQFRTYWTSTTPQINAPVSLAGGGLLDATPTYRIAVVGGPTTGTAWGLNTAGTLEMCYYASATTLTWVNFGTASTPGPNSMGYARVGSSAGRVVPGVDWAGQALVQVVAWEGNFNTWAEAWQAARAGNVRIGISNPLTLTLPASPQSTTLTYLWGLQSFSIDFIPEPTTFALAGLGAAALMIFRRRS